MTFIQTIIKASDFIPQALKNESYQGTHKHFNKEEETQGQTHQQTNPKTNKQPQTSPPRVQKFSLANPNSFIANHTFTSKNAFTTKTNTKIPDLAITHATQTEYPTITDPQELKTMQHIYIHSQSPIAHQLIALINEIHKHKWHKQKNPYQKLLQERHKKTTPITKKRKRTIPRRSETPISSLDTPQTQTHDQFLFPRPNLTPQTIQHRTNPTLTTSGTNHQNFVLKTGHLLSKQEITNFLKHHSIPTYISSQSITTQHYSSITSSHKGTQSYIIKHNQTTINFYPTHGVIQINGGNIQTKTQLISTILSTLKILYNTVIHTTPELLKISQDLFQTCFHPHMNEHTDLITKTTPNNTGLPRHILYHKLLKAGVSHLLLQAIISTYNESTTQVALGSALTNPFSPLNGIKQGSVLSTILFIVFVNDLLKQIKQLHPTSPLANMFVDDLTLNPQSEEITKELMNLVTEYLISHQCIANKSKFQISQHNMKNEMKRLIEQNILPKPNNKQNQITTLGMILSPPYDKHSWSEHIQHRANLANHYATEFVKKGLHTSPSFTQANLTIHKSIIIPILTHGIPIIPPTQKTTKILQKALNKTLKTLLGYHNRSSTEWTLWSSQTLDAKTLWDKLIIIRWRADKIKYLESPNLPYIPHQPPSPIDQYAKQTMKEWGFTPFDIDRWSTDLKQIPTKRKWKNMINETTNAIMFNRFHNWSNSPTQSKHHPYPMYPPLALHRITSSLSHLTTPLMQTKLSLIRHARNNTMGLPGDQSLPTSQITPCNNCEPPHQNHSLTIQDLILKCPKHQPTRTPLTQALITHNHPTIKDFLSNQQTHNTIFHFLLGPTIISSPQLVSLLSQHLEAISQQQTNHTQKK
jgi:hypothetical protein